MPRNLINYAGRQYLAGLVQFVLILWFLHLNTHNMGINWALTWMDAYFFVSYFICYPWIRIYGDEAKQRHAVAGEVQVSRPIRDFFVRFLQILISPAYLSIQFLVRHQMKK